MEGDAEAFTQAEPGIDKGGADALHVLGVNSVVVSLNDCVLAGEVVIGGAESDAGSVGDVAHLGLVEATGTEELKGRVEDGGSAEFAFLGGLDRVEHVQIMCWGCRESQALFL